MNIAENNIQRIRRAKPTRTAPRRNILGMFTQKPKEYTAPLVSNQSTSHPLGFDMDDGAPQQDRIEFSQNQKDIQAASDLIDRHIREGEKFMISSDQNMWSKVSGLTNKLDSAEIAEIAKTLTRSYAEAASLWIDLAGKLREVLSVQTSTNASATAPTIQPPSLCIQAATKVSAKVQMFEVSTVNKPQPLLHAEGMTDPITDISFENGQINIYIPEYAAPGVYNGLILSETDRPIGAISLTIPETPS